MSVVSDTPTFEVVAVEKSSTPLSIGSQQILSRFLDGKMKVQLQRRGLFSLWIANYFRSMLRIKPPPSSDPEPT